jgi:hypothetical protein
MLSGMKIAAALVSTALIGARAPHAETLTIALSGVAETNFAHPLGGTGDLNGWGLVKLTINPAKRQVCYDFAIDGVATPLMAHIRQAQMRRNGPPIVSLFTGTGSDLEGCAPANTGQLADMIEHPSLYYVSIATTEYPDGALRGQLSTS